MVSFHDVAWSDDGYSVSLLKLTGSPIKDIRGMLSSEFGHTVFAISEIVFEDGSVVSVQGEHDIAYVEDYNTKRFPRPKNMDQRTLKRLRTEAEDA